MIQSLASHMCENVGGFKKKLLEQLKRPHEVKCLEDAFHVYINDPLYNLDAREPRLIVVDGLDESEADGKNELLELIVQEFPKFPEWIKILVTSRPEIRVKDKLSHLKAVEIFPNDKDNKADLQQYFRICLPEHLMEKRIDRLLAKKCQGSFLFAFHVRSELRKQTNIRCLSADEIEDFLPLGIGKVYLRYFRRLESELNVANAQLDFRQLLEVLVAARAPLPLSFLSALVKLPIGSHVMKDALRRVNEGLSSLLVVHDDLITIFHKSLRDWLTLNGYEENPYAVDIDKRIGDKYLWEACKKEYKEVNETYPNVNLTSAMKYAVDIGWFHLLYSNNINCFPQSDFEWLLDPCIVHVIATVYPKEVRNLLASWKISLEKSFCTNPHVRRKMLWHFLFYEVDYFSQFSKYSQDRVNDSPPEITSDIEKRAIKSILKHSVWFEKLNGFCEENTKHFLSGILLESKISCIGVSPNQEYCAVGREDGMISLLELPYLREIGTYPTGLNYPVPCCTFSSDDSFLLFGQLRYGFDVKTLNKSSFFTHSYHQFTGCSFSPSGGRLATADSSDTLRLWDVKAQCLLVLFRTEASVDTCTYSECGLFLIGKGKHAIVSLSDDDNGQIVGVWNTITMQRVDRRHPVVSRPDYDDWIEDWSRYTCALHVADIVLSTETGVFGRMIDVYGLPQCVPVYRLWFPLHSPFSVIKYRKTPCLLQYRSDSWSVVDYSKNELAVHPFVPLDYRLRLSLLKSRILACDQVFLIHKTNQLLAFKTPCKQREPQRVITCSFSPDGSHLASCTDNGVVSVWDVHANRVVQSFRQESIACWWSKHYFWIFRMDINRKPILSRYPVNKQLQIKVCEGEDHVVDCILVGFHTFAGGVLVFECYFCEIAVLNVTDEEMKPVAKLDKRHPVECTAVSPDGSCMLMASWEGYEIWSPESNHRQIHSLSYDEEERTAKRLTCCITSDGKLGLIVIINCNNKKLECYVVQIRSGTVLRHDSFRSRTALSYRATICAGCSSLVIKDGSHFQLVDIESCKVLGFLNNPSSTECVNERSLVFHGPQSLLAVPNNAGYIDFVKINVPQ